MPRRFETIRGGSPGGRRNRSGRQRARISDDFGTVGFGKKHAFAFDRRPGNADGGRDFHPRSERGGAFAEGTRCRLGLPNARSFSSPDRFRQPGFRPQSASPRQGRDSASRRGSRRVVGNRRSLETKTKPAFRRPATAGRARSGDREKTGAFAARRTFIQSRPPPSREYSSGFAEPQTAIAFHLHLRHARPSRSPRLGRSRGARPSRTHRANRRAQGTSGTTRLSLRRELRRQSSRQRIPRRSRTRGRTRLDPVRRVRSPFRSPARSSRRAFDARFETGIDFRGRFRCFTRRNHWFGTDRS